MHCYCGEMGYKGYGDKFYLELTYAIMGNGFLLVFRCVFGGLVLVWFG